MGVNNRRQLARTCKKFGLLVQPKALQVLMREMEDRGDRFLDLLEVFKEKLARSQAPKLVSLELVELVLEEERQKEQLALNKTNKRKKNKIVLHAEPEIEIEDESQNPNPPHASEGNNKSRDMFRAAISKPRSISRRKPDVGMVSASSSSNNNKPWKLLSAFHMPKLMYDSMGRQFHYEFSRKSLMGTAKDLMDMRIQRYELVKQKVDRHREQRRLSPLTTIDRLLGASIRKQTNNSRKTIDNSNDEQRTLLGVLRGNPALGCLELEDPTGSVPLRIDISSSSTLFSSSEATRVDTNGVYLEGSMVLVRGHHEESDFPSNTEDSSGTVFRCRSIELPPLENKAETRSNLPPSPHSDDFHRATGSRTPGLRTPVPIYSLANLCLDEEACLERVGDVIDRMIYETGGSSSQDNDNDNDNSNGDIDMNSSNKNPGVGAILVFFGNFCTESSTTSTALDELARLLQDKEIPSQHSVLLVPGPMDVGSNACWPLPAWTKRNTPSSLHPLLASEMEESPQNSRSQRSKTSAGGNVYLCTNPCRLEFSDGRQVVLMRKDLIRESLHYQVLTDADSSSESDTHQRTLPPLVSRVFHHTMSQCHLSPSSSSQQAASTSCSPSPIYWNYDHAMALYPLPDLMILGLDAEYLEDGAHYGRAGCRIVSPISNPSRNEWQCSVTTLGKRKDKIYVEFDNEDDEDEEEADGDEEVKATEPSQTDEEIYASYRAMAGTQDTQLSQTQLAAY